MFMWKSQAKWLAGLALCLMAALPLAGCDGDDGDDSVATTGGSSTPTTVSGVAATGRPIIGLIEVFDAAGKLVASGSSNKNGVYSLNVGSAAGPFFVRATRDQGAEDEARFFSYVESATSSNTYAANVSQFTHAAVQFALGQDPAQGFTSGAALDKTKLKEARDAVNARMAVLLGKNFNVFTDAFSADLTGFDAVLEQFPTVSIPTGTTVAIKVTVVGDSATKDLSTFTSADVGKTAKLVGELVKPFQRLEQLHAGGKTPSEADLKNAATGMASYLPTDYLDDGLALAGQYAQWASATSPYAGFEFNGLTIVEPMKSLDVGGTTVKEYGAHAQGWWCQLSYKAGGKSKTRLVGLVSDATTDAGTWLLAGNRMPYSTYDKPHAFGLKANTPSGAKYVHGGLNLYRAGGAEYGSAVTTLVLGPGLNAPLVKYYGANKVATSVTVDPSASTKTTYANGLIMVRTGAHDSYYSIENIANKSGAWDYDFYTVEDGFDPTKVKAGDIYRCVALTSAGQPVTAWAERLVGQPKTPDQLPDSLFPVIAKLNDAAVDPLTTNVSSAIVSGKLKLAWTVPTGLTPYRARLRVFPQTGDPIIFDKKLDAPDATFLSNTFDLASLTFTPTRIDLDVYAKDATGATIRARARLAGSPGVPTAKKFGTVSDTHVYDNILGASGSAFEAYLASDRKLLKESAAINAAYVKAITTMPEAERPKFILVTGDLTKDGEHLSHLLFAAFLNQLENAGVKCFVLPGNHDVSNPHAVSFSGATTTKVANVSPDGFKRLYWNYGYGEAFSTDPASLSYAVEPVKDLWVLALDSCRYYDNTATEPITAGQLKEDTLKWVESLLAEAKTKGKTVVAGMHHGLLEHYAGQATLFSEYVVKDYKTVSKRLADAGLRLMFTGHYHANDVTKLENGANPIFDAETGSLVTSPCPYRIVTIDNNVATIKTSNITAIDYDLGGLTFPAYANLFLDQGLLSIATATLTAPTSMGGYGLPAGNPTTIYLSQLIAAAFKAHYAGDEKPDAATLGAIQTFMASPDATQKTLGQSLYVLWTDLPPADGNVSLNLTTGASTAP